MAKKQRLDIAVYERGLAHSRSKAQGMIMAREVFVNGEIVDKAGTKITESDTLSLKDKPRFVSRGGEKLAGALIDFNYDPDGKIVADVGASTGGFTDCLLKNGAERVYAIDVGYGQIDYRLRIDERVIVIERTNARYLESLDENVDLCVVDASFISLRLLFPVMKKWLLPNGDIIALIKPQFEAGRDEVGKGGIVRDPAIHRSVLNTVLEFAESINLYTHDLTTSPIRGSDGNKEFLALLSTIPNELPQSEWVEKVLATTE